MEGFMIRVWDRVLSRWRYSSTNPRRVEISTPCRTMSTRGTAVFVPGSLEL